MNIPTENRTKLNLKANTLYMRPSHCSGDSKKKHTQKVTGYRKKNTFDTYMTFIDKINED
jgi:hypothetical protein